MSSVFFSSQAFAICLSCNSRINAQVSTTAINEAGSEVALFQLKNSSSYSRSGTISWEITGDAVNGVDYQSLPALSGTVPAPSAQQIVTIATIIPVNDQLFDKNETITFTITGKTGVDVSLGNLSTTLTVVDDDTPAATLLNLDNIASETASDPGLYTVKLNKAVTVDQTVYYAISGTAFSGSDYAGLTGEVTIPAYRDQAEIIITPVDDSLDEYDEDVVLTLTDGVGYQLDPSGANLSATLKIADDDLNLINIIATDATSSESGTDIAQFTITRLGILDYPLTIFYQVGGTATNGLDFSENLSGSLTFPAGTGIGTQSSVITLSPINDALVEGDESISISINQSTAYTLATNSSVTATIIDNDSASGMRTTDTGVFLQEDWVRTSSDSAIACTTKGGTWFESQCIATHDANQSGWTGVTSA
ncbi:MAG: Calx-beta domain-containing protein, partial [Gammaproteobacteria bacterium]